MGTRRLTEVVYAEYYGDLIFIPRDKAEEWATVRDVLETARTWCEFQALMPPHRYDEIMEMLSDAAEYQPDERAVPKLDDAFNASDIPGFEDGDWPEWPEQEMLSWVPKDVQRQHGERSPSALNGDALTLEASRAPEIIAAFEQHGYICREDPELIRRACGKQ